MTGIGAATSYQTRVPRCPLSVCLRFLVTTVMSAGEAGGTDATPRRELVMV